MKQLLTIVFLGLLSSVPAFCQEPTNPMFTSSLVAWTTMQTPQPPEQNPLPSRPAPDPQPNVQVPENPPDSSTAPAPPESQQPSEEAQSAARTFTGTVAKQGDTYVLSVEGSESYKLDDQDRAKQFDGQKVKVFGVLDQGSAVLHAQTITPLS
jgi:Protein of unknown function (DUF5818)